MKQRSGDRHYQRPFEKTGFIPLPTSSKKYQPPTTQPHPISSSTVPKIHDPTCLDCYDDCYQDKLSELLLYKLTNRYSPRVESIPNPKVRQHEEYIIWYKANNFVVYSCQNGTYHLRENNRKVLMVRQIFRLTAQVHGQFHHDGQLMRTIIKTEYPWVCLYYITQFLLEFPLMCPYCQQFPATEPSLMPTPKSRIWYYLFPTRVDRPLQQQQSLNQILTYSRPSQHFPYTISPNIQPLESLLHQLRHLKKFQVSSIMDPYTCQPDTCQHDEYEPEYLICLFVFKESQYPLIKTNAQIGRLIYAIRAKIKEFEVRVCNQGTDHLWHRGRNQRILMKQEINTVLNALHHGNIPDSEAANQEGKGTFHRSWKLMTYMLQKQKNLYPYNIIGSIKWFLNRCIYCSKKKLYHEYKRQQIVFEETEMIKFRMKLLDARKRYRATKQIPKSLSYDQMVNRNNWANVSGDGVELPTVVNGEIVDPNDLKDPDHKPEVKAMLQQYVNNPELFQFFSNDLLWLQSFNTKSYPSMLQDQNLWIRKYSYDGMYRMILLTTQSMRDNYFQNGQVLCIDFVPMMLKRRSPSGRHFEVGFLTGLDRGNQGVLFGVCFMSEDLMMYYRKMLEYFFEMMDQITPGAVVTGSSRGLGHALYLMKKQQPLRYRFNHYINWFYVIEDLKKDLSGQYDRNQMLAQFCRLLVQSNPITHEKRLIEITSQIVERSILEKFLKDKNKYCLSCLRPAFMGYSLETRRVEKLYEMLTENFIYQSRMAHFMFSIFNLEKTMNNRKNKIDVQKNMEIIGELITAESAKQSNKSLPQITEPIIQQLIWAAQTLSPYILNKFLQNFLQSQKLTLHLTSSSSSSSRTPKQKQEQSPHQAYFLDQNNLKYTVRYCPQDQCWRCSCTWIYWTGIPCCHLMKILLALGGELSYYVSQRWRVEGDQEDQDEGHEMDGEERQEDEKEINVHYNASQGIGFAGDISEFGCSNMDYPDCQMSQLKQNKKHINNVQEQINNLNDQQKKQQQQNKKQQPAPKVDILEQNISQLSLQ